MDRKPTRLVRAGLLAAIISTLLCLSTGKVKGNRGLPPGLRRFAEAATPQEGATAQQHLGVNFRMADASLEVREQVDFLLTPALLVQQAVSDGVVLTYPEE
jgi:hypothetical protein